MKDSPARHKRRCLKRSARNRNIAFSLSTQFVADLLAQPYCYYTGRLLTPESLSVDRKNCHQGYLEDNVVLCDKSINALKSQILENPDTRLSNEELKIFLSRMQMFVS